MYSFSIGSSQLKGQSVSACTFVLHVVIGIRIKLRLFLVARIKRDAAAVGKGPEEKELVICATAPVTRRVKGEDGMRRESERERGRVLLKDASWSHNRLNHQTEPVCDRDSSV